MKSRLVAALSVLAAGSVLVFSLSWGWWRSAPGDAGHFEAPRPERPVPGPQPSVAGVVETTDLRTPFDRAGTAGPLSRRHRGVRDYLPTPGRQQRPALHTRDHVGGCRHVRL